MVIEKDLGKMLSELSKTLSNLGLDMNDLKSSVHGLEKSQQFLISIKSLKILEKIFTGLTDLKGLLEKSELKDFLTQAIPIIKSISNSVKDLSIEFNASTARLIPLLTIAILTSMISSVTTLAILYQFQILGTPSFLVLTLMVLFVTVIALLSLYLKLLLVLTLAPLAALPSLVASTIGLILHRSMSPVIIILIVFNIILLVALLRFLILQANAYKIAISIVASIYRVIDELKTIAENKLRTAPASQLATPNEVLFTKVYGNEASELIKYATDVNKVK